MNYHDRPELSSTQVACAMDDLVEFYHVHREGDWPKSKTTPAMQFGSAVHRMIELGGPEHVAAVIPPDCLNAKGHRRGSAWTQFSEETLEANPDAHFINPGEVSPLHVIWDHLLKNDYTRPWLDAERKEEEIFWTHRRTGLSCRAKLDVIDSISSGVIHLPLIMDWKTTVKTTLKGIQYDFHQRHYPERLCFYQDGMIETLGPEWSGCVIIATTICNKGGYRVRPIRIAPDWLAAARKRLEKTLDDIASLNIDVELNQSLIELGEPRSAQYENQYELESEDDNE